MYNLEKNEKELVTVKIIVEGEEFKKAKEEILKKYKEAKIDGFRKGHAPLDVIEKQFAGNIREDLYSVLVNKEFAKALEAEKLEPMTGLEVVKEEITKDKLDVTITFEAVPNFELPKYKGLEVEVDNLPEVDEKAVEDALKNVASRLKTREAVDREIAENGDVANIDFEGFVDGVAFEGGKSDNFDLVLGSHSFIDNFEDQIIGHKIGDEFEVNVTFPVEYHAENLKGKPAVFKVKLNSLKVEKMPEINDELAKKQGYDTLEDFRTFVKGELKTQRESQMKNIKFQKIADKLVENLDIVIPEKVLEAEKNREVEEFKKQLAQYGQNFEDFLKRSGKTKEEFEKDALLRATNTVKFRLIASKIIKEENLEVSNEDIDKSLQAMAAQYKMTVEQLREELQKMNLLENYTNEIANNLMTEKLKGVLVENN